MDNKWIGISEFIPKVWTSLFIFIQGRSTRQNQTLNHCVPIATLSVLLYGMKSESLFVVFMAICLPCSTLN